MKKSSLKDYIEIVGIAAIVGSLMFVGLQLRQDREIALASVRAAFFESLVAIRSDIIQNAEIWETGLAGGELSSADAIVFRSLAVTIRRQAVLESQQVRLLGQGGTFSIVQFADLVRQNPGLEQEMIKEDARVRAWLAANSPPLQAGSFRDQYKEAIERLEQLDPPTDSL